MGEQDQTCRKAEREFEGNPPIKTKIQQKVIISYLKPELQDHKTKTVREPCATSKKRIGPTTPKREGKAAPTKDQKIITKLHNLCSYWANSQQRTLLRHHKQRRMRIQPLMITPVSVLKQPENAL